MITNFSNIYFLVPELDESSLTNSINVAKDSVNSIHNSKNNTFSSNKMSNTTKQTANTTATGSRASRASQNELTLPPIVEAQVSNIQNNNSNAQNKKSNSNIRVDSGIIHDYNSENGGAGWTLSPQGSDNGVDKSNTPSSGANYKHTVITTVEIVENPNSLKKNATSSTLNSYGKSSSIQSKLTTATTNSSNNKKFNLSATSTSSSAANKPNAQAGHLTAIASEQDYIESIAKLHSIPDFSENHENTNLFKSKAGSVNNLAKQDEHAEDYVNSHYYSNVSNGNGSNYYSVNGSTKPLERSLTTYNINNRGGANLNHFSSNFQANPSSRNKSPFRNKEFSDKFNNSNTNLNTSFNTPRGKPQQQNLARQNTTLTDIKDFSPLVTRRNSNLANNSQTQIGKNSTNGQQQPVPKPRRVEKRTNSLQRQSTFMPVNSNIDNSFMSQNTSRQPAQPQPQQPQRQDNRSKFTINTNPVNPNEKSNENRPKTGLNRQANKNSNNTLINQSVNNNLNSSNTLVKLNSVNNNNSIDLVQAKVAPAETSTSKNNNNTANTSDNQNSNELNNLNLIPLETLTGINNETGLNDYTVLRILKWLEDVESCANKIKPPSQLTWSNNNNNAKFERHHSNDMGRNFNNEYYLSDYDSADDQIIEYNRIVDKTFHIVHDED
jgi:hypothetical protein